MNPLRSFIDEVFYSSLEPLFTMKEKDIVIILIPLSLPYQLPEYHVYLFT